MMDTQSRYRNQCGGNRSSGGPMFTLCSAAPTRGAQLLMNAPSVSSATQFQFISSRKFVSRPTIAQPAKDESTHKDGLFSVFSNIKGFFSNLLYPKSSTIIPPDVLRKYSNSSHLTTDMELPPDKQSELMNFICFSDLPIKLETNMSGEPTDNSKEVWSTPMVSMEHIPNEVAKNDLIDTMKPKDQESSVSRNRRRPKKKVTKRIKSQAPVGIKSKVGNPAVINSYTLHVRKNRPISGKHRKEKIKHQIAWNIHEDLANSTRFNSWDEEIDENLKCNKPKSMEQTQDSHELNTIRKPGSSSRLICFTTEDFPAMPVPKANLFWELPMNERACAAFFRKQRQRQISECDSEDSFIVFTHDSPPLTPSTSMESLNQIPISICDRFRQSIRGRQRQISESSDDYICFELDENEDCDGDETEEEKFKYTSDSDTENEDDDTSVGTSQPDSGFEEKKVRFNLNHQVHVLRTWNFAYREARKGPWEQIGRDRVRFHDRINRMSMILNPILLAEHRAAVFSNRFEETSESNDEEYCDAIECK